MYFAFLTLFKTLFFVSNPAEPFFSIKKEAAEDAKYAAFLTACHDLSE